MVKMSIRNPLVIFGAGRIAEVVWPLFQQHSQYTPIAITLDAEYCQSKEWRGLPLVPFEELEKHYPPGEFSFFVALGYQRLNDLRTEKLASAKKRGYAVGSFIHPESGLPNDVAVGENCFIMHNVNIHPEVTISDNVFVWSGATICHHSIVSDNCWFTSGASIAGGVRVGRNCILGINATVTHNVEIGDYCFLGAGSLVNTPLETESVVVAPATEKYPLDSRRFVELISFDEI
jgi:sugar O-acyltransferase (sialic acid O-acetyltransferase NeuD family)